MSGGTFLKKNKQRTSWGGGRVGVVLSMVGEGHKDSLTQCGDQGTEVEETASAKALRQCAQETARKPVQQEQIKGGGRAVGMRSAGSHRALSPGSEMEPSAGKGFVIEDDAVTG